LSAALVLALGHLYAMAGVPVFEAESLGDIQTAEAAWVAGLACTGWEPKTHPVIRMETGPVRGGYLGRAYHDTEGLYLVELDGSPERHQEVIVHEIAHAWVTDGPPTLREGRTELLADCIVRQQPGIAPLQWDDGRTLDGMPDLTSWSNPHDHGPALANARTSAYLGAARLVRTAGMLLPERALWPETGLDWDEFRTLLTDAGEPGRHVLALLDAGPERQRAALSDEDLDGLPLVAEELLGTDAASWDTDGDGWWDGTPKGGRRAPIPLPLDGSPVCTGLVAGARGAIVYLRTGGNLRGTGLPVASVPGAQSMGGAVWQVPAGQHVLVHLQGSPDATSGGIWASLAGHGVEESNACVSRPTLSVWSEQAWQPHASSFADLVVEAAAKAEERWGPTPGRIAVALGGRTTLVEGDVVVISHDDLKSAVTNGSMREVAHLAVALHRSWKQGFPQYNVAEALARALAES
jgi:hypothetical protein